MDDPDVVFAVVGAPVTQGSKRALLPRGQTRPVIVDDNRAALKSWRRLITELAREAWPRPPIDGPVAVGLAFKLARPQRPQWLFPAVKPDIDKLARAALDAITDARVWRDDAQVVQMHATKVYECDGEPPGLVVKIWRVR